MGVAKFEPTRAPFPYFGGKSAVAGYVWERIGNVPNYVEPFFGSGAVLLSRPHDPQCETVNDSNGYVANFWRAVKCDPEQVSWHADNPVNENDLHARHAWLVGRRKELPAMLEGDPDYFDAKIAGWWCWGMCCWIGGRFCEGEGPWRVVDGQLVHLGGKGKGINRQRVHLGDKGMGILLWMQELAERLELVRVCCGDWERVCGDTPTITQGLTGVFLDPPYLHETANGNRDVRVYGEHDCGEVAHRVREWAIERGDNPLFRIILCGYDDEHAMPDNWDCVPWKTRGGYGSQGSQGAVNAHRECLWISPHCISQQGMLF